MRSNWVQDLVVSHHTIDLYKQYRKHLGPIRYFILIESQKLVCPAHVCKLMGFGRVSWVTPLLTVYKLSRKVKLDWFLKSTVLPNEHKEQIRNLDRPPEVG